MTTRNQAFQFASPFGNPQRPARGNRQPVQQEQVQYEDEVDPEWVVQAFMKIGFRMNNGKVKFLKMGKTDKQLRTGSPLESMILTYWAKGGDLNELVKTMVIEINDAMPDADDEDIDFAFEAPTKPAPNKPKRTRATTAETDEE